jgi:hypothetical protein
MAPMTKAAWASLLGTTLMAGSARAQTVPAATRESTAQASSEALGAAPSQSPPTEAARGAPTEPPPEGKREPPATVPPPPEAKHDSAHSPVGPPPTGPEVKGEQAGADWVEISLSTDEPGVTLYAKEPRKVTVGEQVADAWVSRCNAPCNERVDPRLTYRVMGDGILPSVEFRLAPNSGRVALQVSPAKQSSRTIGGVMVGLGAASALAGVLSVLVDVAERGAAGAVPDEMAGAKASLFSSATTYENIGIGFITAGLVMEAGALVLLLTSKTNLTPIAPHTGAVLLPAPANGGSGVGGLRFVPGGFAF